MKALAWLCAVVCALGVGIASAETTPREEPGAVIELVSGARIINARDRLRISADEGLTVLSSNVYWKTRDDGDSVSSCIIYAEIRNDTDHAVYLNGSLQFGEATMKNILCFSPLRVEPGQSGYFSNSMHSDIRPFSARELNEIQLSLTDGPVNQSEVIWRGEPVLVDDQDDNVVIEPTRAPDWTWDTDALRVTMTNRTGQPLPNPAVVVAAYDAQGRLIYVVGSEITVDRTAAVCYIPDGSPWAIMTCIPKTVSQFMTANDLEVSEYRTIVYGCDRGGTP